MTIEEAYAALGLDGALASPGDVRARFRDLIRANHPDFAPLERQARANETTRRLVEAYSTVRQAGYPRVSRDRGARASFVDYAPQEPAEAEPADPLAWVDEAWRESVRRKPPEDAMTGAVLRAAWWSFGALLLVVLGLPALAAGAIVQDWVLAALGIVGFVFGLRLALAAWRMVIEVGRFWRVWSRVADRPVRARVRRALATRAAIALATLVALAIAVRILIAR